jgi:hypothetical protein
MTPNFSKKICTNSRISKETNLRSHNQCNYNNSNTGCINKDSTNNIDVLI